MPASNGLLHFYYLLSMQVCKRFQETISANHIYWDEMVGQLMTARFLAPKGYFSKSTFTSFHKLVRDLVLCRDCGAFADWPVGQKVCKECCQVPFNACHLLNLIS